MPLQIPPELKKITPYVRRAEELDRDKANPESRLVAYYCRQYAVHSGIELATSPAGKSCLGSLLSNLEEEKEAMGAFTSDESKFLCEKFANKIFEKADTEDRVGGATKNTAKTFYAAASFLEMLQQFYKDDDESEEWAEIKKRSVYSKWKATEILKAIKEGREPTPGGYGESLEEEEGSTDNAQSNEQSGGEATSPKVETVVTDDNDDEEVKEEKSEDDPGRIFVPPPEADDDEEEDQGTEVELGGPPPPTYPGPSAPSASTFTPVPPPASEPELPPPPSSVPMMPPPPAQPVAAPEPATKKSGGGFFGLGKKKNKKNKAEIADAMELTKFALAALEEKNTDLAADRLQKALKVLGR